MAIESAQDVASRPGNLFKSEPPRHGVFRVFDKDRQPLGVAFWHGDGWGPSTFDRLSLEQDPGKKLKKAPFTFWAHYRAPRPRKIPFAVMRVRADVVQLLESPNPLGPRGLVLEEHLTWGQVKGLPIYCYIPPLVAQQAEILEPDGAYEILAQTMIEPPRQWRGAVAEGYVWIEAIDLSPIKRRRAAPTQSKFVLKKGGLRISSRGKSLTLSRDATLMLKTLIGA